MIKAVIFDCFGVLTEDGWLAFLHKFASDSNSEQLSDLNHQVDRGQMSYEEFLEAVIELTGAKKEEAHAMITTTHHPDERLFAYAKKLKNASYKLGVISNVGAELTNYLPKEYVDMFDCITLSYQVGTIKPAPEIYQHQLNLLQLPPEQTIFIDDREPNCDGARAVGMQAIWHTSYETTMQLLSDAGVSV